MIERKKFAVLKSSFHSVYSKDRPQETVKIIQPTPHQLGNISLNRREVEEGMKNLDKRKANGLDDIYKWMLREYAEELSEPLELIYKNSLIQGKLPEIWNRLT